MKKRYKKENIYNLPNSLTLLRILMTFILVWIILAGYSIKTVTVLFLFAAFTDFLDGYFARKLNQITEFGKAFDPVADRMLLIFTVIALMLEYKLYILALIFSRELIALPALIFFKKGDIKFEVKPIGKITMILQSITVPLVLLGVKYYMFFVFLTFISGIFSGITYFKQTLKLKKK